MATGYSVFANNGHKIEPFLVDTITDSQGGILFQETPLTVVGNTLAAAPITPSILGSAPTLLATESEATAPPKVRAAPRVMDERISYIMNSILRDVVERGTAKKAKALKRKDIGGKTGTTNGPTDAWFSGFNQHLVATAWVGFDNNKKIGKREYGGTAALPIWIEFMRTALKGVPEQLPPRPDGIVTVRINPETGEITTPDNPNGIDEIFLEENVPTAVAESIDSDTGNNVSPEDIF